MLQYTEVGDESKVCAHMSSLSRTAYERAVVVHMSKAKIHLPISVLFLASQRSQVRSIQALHIRVRSWTVR